MAKQQVTSLYSNRETTSRKNRYAFKVDQYRLKKPRALD